MTRVSIVGYKTEYHIGSHFYNAAKKLALDVEIIDPITAQGDQRIIRSLYWRIGGRRPVRLNSFSSQLVEHLTLHRPSMLLVTGIAPPNYRALYELKDLGIRLANYLTDDPWNAVHRAPWFMKALSLYDHVFTPRRANLSQLQELCEQVSYLPFAYSEDAHFPEAAPIERMKDYKCDVLFFGGADKDRIPLMRSIIDTGLEVHLYGGYWNRHAFASKSWKGHADLRSLRWAVNGAKVTVCLVRRANRDGHVMRTYEVAAMAGTMLAEDTSDHHDILGPHAFYFANEQEAIDKINVLLNDENLRRESALEVHRYVTASSNTYRSRLRDILTTMGLQWP